MTDHDDTEALAALLYEHRPRVRRSFTNDNTVLDCCGQTFGNATRKGRRGDEERAWKAHAAHVAEVVLAAYVARKVSAAKAEAWEEGFNAGSISAMQKLHTKPNFTPNPYRDQS